jgi:double-stranded uracil-DNA glycosylase
LLGPIVGPGLRVLFVGINPSLRSAEVGHHFARPGNRFWPTLHAAGFTPRRLRPEDDHELPAYGVGVTNIADRPTRAADELTLDELRSGAAELERVVALHAPRLVAVVGLTAYRLAFGRPRLGHGVAARDDRRPAGLGPAEPERPERPLQAGRLRAFVRRGAGLRRRAATPVAGPVRLNAACR